LFKRSVLVASLVALLAGLLPAAQAADAHTATNAEVRNPNDGTKIAITVFQPAGSDASSPVGIVLHSHGWGGSRTKTVSGVVKEFLDAGIGVISIDQRGHGESEGEANVQDPTLETEDIKAVIDYAATLDWVRHDLDASGVPIANDPVLGAIGGSYGGGYQTMTALDEIADAGRTRFNAIAPEITWYDLPESLAPQGVVRTAWNTALYAAGASMVPQYIHEAFAYGLATGQWPDGTILGEPNENVPDLDAEFHKHSPVSFAEQGIKINVPVLQRQGISDNLFNLNQGLHIFNDAVTDSARSQSYFVGYNGGHVLPNAVPLGTAGGSDACSPGGFTKTSIAFFQDIFSGASTDGLLPKRYNLTTTDGTNCLSFGNLDGEKKLPVDPTGTGSVVATAGLGAPLHLPIAEGPITASGIPTLSGTLTALGVDTRAFFGLSIGTTPADAMVVSNNLMPLHRLLPVQDEAFKIELPGVAVEVPEGQSLFLTVTPVSDMFFGHGSRTPGAFLLSDLAVGIPGEKTCTPKGNGGGNGKGKGKGHAKPCA
jgi:pimeloyl-ACP methyl ester carboxylesterase